MGFHCTDCIFASFARNKKSGKYRGACSRGFTLTDPHVHTSPDDHFSEDPRNLVPTVDPFGEEYLRTSNVCDRFHPSEEAQAHEGTHGWWHAICEGKLVAHPRRSTG